MRLFTLTSPGVGERIVQDKLAHHVGGQPRIDETTQELFNQVAASKPSTPQDQHPFRVTGPAQSPCGFSQVMEFLMECQRIPPLAKDLEVSLVSIKDHQISLLKGLMALMHIRANGYVAFVNRSFFFLV